MDLFPHPTDKELGFRTRHQYAMFLKEVAKFQVGDKVVVRLKNVVSEYDRTLGIVERIVMHEDKQNRYVIKVGFATIGPCYFAPDELKKAEDKWKTNS